MRERKDHFWKVFLIVLLVLIVLAAAGLFVLWKYLGAYEDTLPETVINAYISDQGTEYWVNGVRSTALAAEGKFDYEYSDEDVPDVTAQIAKGWSERRIIAESGDDKDVYMISAGGTDIAKLSLKPTGDKTFGFSYWAVDSAEFVNGNEQTVTVLVPDGATLSINGKEVPDSYITSETELECDVKEPFDKAPAASIYSVGELYGKIELSVVDENDNELEAETVDGRVQYMPGEEGYLLYAVAPKDAVVSVGDYALTPEYKEPFSKSELCEGFADYVDDSALVRFVCQGLYSKPELSAKDAAGKAITGSEMVNGGTLFLGKESKELGEAQKSFIEDFAKRYVSFATNAGDDIMVNYGNLIALVLPGSDLAKRFEGAIEPMSWVDGATVEYNDLQVSDFIPLGESAYACTLSYSLINSTNYEDRAVEESFTLLVVKTGDLWLVANMLADR